MKILNATDLKPVSASYAGDEYITFDGDVTRITTNDGYPYIVSTLMNSLVDVSTNKYSFMGMTSAMNTTDLLSDISVDIETKGPLAISTTNTLESMIGADLQYNMVVTDFYSDECVMF